jgi:chitin disaccharide deacetylase
MDEAALLAALSRLSGGVTEIYLHPATQYGIAHSMASYRPTDELAALLSPRVHAAMDSLDVQRGGFSDFWPARGAA